MARRRRENKPQPWKGDAVAKDGGAPGEAERAADRAEGKSPIAAADAAERAGDDDDAVAPPRPDPDAPSPDEQIADVAEEHRERHAAGDRGRGKL